MQSHLEAIGAPIEVHIHDSFRRENVGSATRWCQSLLPIWELAITKLTCNFSPAGNQYATVHTLAEEIAVSKLESTRRQTDRQRFGGHDA